MGRLPSLDTLRVFSIAARHRSFTKAAGELHLTQSAISHRVRALEEELGVTLFDRLPRRLELTRAGQVLAQRVDQAVGDITRTIANLDLDDDTRRLTVTLLPSVASRWLVPRLSRFHALYPNIQLQLIADPRLLDLRAARIDLAIRFGRGTYPGYAVTKLMSDHVFPVCSPRLLAQHGPVDTLDALLDLPLLHDSATEGDGRGSDWRSWLKHVGRHDAPCDKGQRFSGAGLLIDAAVLGLGAALVRRFQPERGAHRHGVMGRHCACLGCCYWERHHSPDWPSGRGILCRLQPGRVAHRYGISGRDRAHLGQPVRNYADEGASG